MCNFSQQYQISVSYTFKWHNTLLYSLALPGLYETIVSFTSTPTLCCLERNLQNGQYVFLLHMFPAWCFLLHYSYTFMVCRELTCMYALLLKCVSYTTLKYLALSPFQGCFQWSGADVKILHAWCDCCGVVLVGWAGPSLLQAGQGRSKKETPYSYLLFVCNCFCCCEYPEKVSSLWLESQLY